MDLNILLRHLGRPGSFGIVPVGAESHDHLQCAAGLILPAQMPCVSCRWSQSHSSVRSTLPEFGSQVWGSRCTTVGFCFGF